MFNETANKTNGSANCPDQKDFSILNMKETKVQAYMVNQMVSSDYFIKNLASSNYPFVSKL